MPMTTGSMPKLLQGKRTKKKKVKQNKDSKGETSADRQRNRGGHR
jgi:hypothetical protein